MFPENLRAIFDNRKVNKAKYCRHLGIARTTLDDYLSERSYMTSDKIEKTAEYFNVSVASLFGETVDQNKNIWTEFGKLTQQMEELTRLVHEFTKK